MKLVTYLKENHDQLALLINDRVYDLDNLNSNLPGTMTMFLNYWDDNFPIAHSLNKAILEGGSRFKGVPVEDVEIIAPVPSPTSCRDGYAFKQHVASARRNRRVEMIPEFDQFPIFY
ncbi:MAG: fumarylacetoacetate hydrolase family protein, partial [Ginsengibacter sp.]